jgi:hypothetical protein
MNKGYIARENALDMYKYLLVLLCLLTSVHAHAADLHENGSNATEMLNVTAGAAAPQCLPYEASDSGRSHIIIGLLLLGALLLVLQSRYYATKPSMLLFGALFVFGVALTLYWFEVELNTESSKFSNTGVAHDHADFQVMVNNQLVDFTNDVYMSYPGHTLSRYIHLHHIDNVVHVHASGVTWNYFFETLEVPMNDTCITVQGTPICNATFLVNGEPVSTPGDRALFHYGTGNASAFFTQAVGDMSCVYEGTCPERGIAVGCAG